MGKTSSGDGITIRQWFICSITNFSKTSTGSVQEQSKLPTQHGLTITHFQLKTSNKHGLVQNLHLTEQEKKQH